MSIALIIPAAGVGKRFSSKVKKQFFCIDNKPILYYTIKRLIDSYPFDEVILGLSEDDISFAENIIKDINVNIPVKYILGGKERVHTVLNCISLCNQEYVAVHDSVRPFAADNVIKEVIEYGVSTGAAICGLPVRDTVKYVENNVIIKTVSRDNLFLAHTPQVFKRDILMKALEYALENNQIITDEASAMEFMGYKVTTVFSNYENIKVTYIEDIETLSIYKNKFFNE